MQHDRGEEARMGHFVRVARMRDIAPGALLRVEIAGRLVCLANGSGTIYAVDDDCTHTGGPLDEGGVEGCVLTCPVHLARFDVRTGAAGPGPPREDLQSDAAVGAGQKVYL